MMLKSWHFHQLSLTPQITFSRGELFASAAAVRNHNYRACGRQIESSSRLAVGGKNTAAISEMTWNDAAERWTEYSAFHISQFNSSPRGLWFHSTVVVPLELSSKEENKLHMSHLRLAEWNNVSCFSLTESLCHVKLWRWKRRGEGESIERQRLLTSGSTPPVIAAWWTSQSYVSWALPPRQKQNNKHFSELRCQKRYIFMGNHRSSLHFDRKNIKLLLFRNSINSTAQIVAYLIDEPVPSIFIKAPRIFCSRKINRSSLQRDFHEIFLRQNLCGVGELFTVSFSPRLEVIIHVLSTNEILNEIHHNKESDFKKIFFMKPAPCYQRWTFLRASRLLT